MEWCEKGEAGTDCRSSKGVRGAAPHKELPHFLPPHDPSPARQQDTIDMAVGLRIVRGVRGVRRARIAPQAKG